MLEKGRQSFFRKHSTGKLCARHQTSLVGADFPFWLFLSLSFYSPVGPLNLLFPGFFINSLFSFFYLFFFLSRNLKIKSQMYLLIYHLKFSLTFITCFITTINFNLVTLRAKTSGLFTF